MVEANDERFDINVAGGVGGDVRVDDIDTRLGTPQQPAVPLHPPDRVDTGPASDRDDPGAGRGLDAVSRQRSPHPHEHVLHDVFGLGGPDEMGHETPHVGLHCLHHGCERSTVTVASVEEETGHRVQRDPTYSESARIGATCHNGGVQPDEPDEPDDVTVTARRASLTDVGGVPDVSARVMELLEPDRSTSTTSKVVRIALGGIGIAQFVLAVPMFVFGEHDDLMPHAARHFGSFSIALGAGMLYTALRPRRVGAFLPFVGVLTVAFAIAAIVDVAQRRTPLGGEAQHLVELTGLVLLWIVARLERPRRERRHR